MPTEQDVKFSDFIRGLPEASEDDFTAGNNMPLVRSGDVKKLAAGVSSRLVFNAYDKALQIYSVPSSSYIEESSTYASGESIYVKFGGVFVRGLDASIGKSVTLTYSQILEQLGVDAETSPAGVSDCIKIADGATLFFNINTRQFRIDSRWNAVLSDVAVIGCVNGMVSTISPVMLRILVDQASNTAHNELDLVNKNFLFFVGNGSTYSQSQYNSKIPCKRRLKLYIQGIWEKPAGVAADSYVFNVSVFKKDNTYYPVIAVTPSQDISASYDLYIDEDPNDVKYIQFGGRANAGVVAAAYFVDVTETTELLKITSTKKVENLGILNLEQGSLSQAHRVDSRTDRVCTGSCVALPKEDLSISVKLPSNMRCAIASVLANGATLTDSGWLTNGRIYAIPSGKKSYAVSFSFNNNATITPAYVRSLVDSGEIALTYEDDNTTTYSRNTEKLQWVASLKSKLIESRPWHKTLPMLAHISDIHGDYKRLKNFVEFCDKVGVDAMLNSGDSVLYNHIDGSKYQDEIVAESSIPYLFAIGNHESQPTGQQNLFADNMSNLADTQGYLIAADTTTNKCYYYKDFDNLSLRVVVINYYENGVYAGHLGNAQLTWLASTLAATPSGYGVIVMLHSPEDKVVASAPYDVFRQKHRALSYQEDGFFVGNRPIMQMVDAFIGKTTATISYSEADGEAVSVSVDFTTSTAEFICYVAGHRHEDWVGYYSRSTHKQLCLGVTSGTAMYGDSSNAAWANQEDLPRGGVGVEQDAFNLYGVDRDKGVIKIVRIGSSVTETMVKREMMEIPYK